MILLLVIDVQGHELNVLKGLDFRNFPPKHIYVENDLNNGLDIFDYLTSKNYKWIAGSNDLVFKLKI